ncbi:MAG: hypothetical protein LBE92_08970 [Chryseobacterium sp.]|jgi:hypothetical protein|uniref:hypothetical protein n=1 Tax=Chryseobacterium sp. TaxID=1871047 RepID=UPI00282F895F|nr:hypothetical protein [Chryseobacterium sp.]MDR2236242.1 hypothetical protein [Chryseobacterium sp.]
MKKIILTLFLGAGLLLSGQVGINTDTPKAKLDVNGDLNLRNKIVVLNTTDGSLSQGNHDQLLVSQGEGYPPIWKSLRIPEYEPNKFYLIFNNSFSDRKGIKFTSSEQFGTAARSTAFVKGTHIDNLAGFKKIPGLSQPIKIFSETSKTYFQFETVVQANFPANKTTDISIDYACGIFVDDKLVNMRQRNLKASSAASTFITHNQIGVIENLSKGDHSVSVACSRIASYETGSNVVLAIGINAADNINDFITQSSLKVDVYEIPQVFKPIIN